MITHAEISEVIYTASKFTHRYLSKKGTCACGWDPLPYGHGPDRSPRTSDLQHAKHVADVIALEVMALLSSGK